MSDLRSTDKVILSKLEDMDRRREEQHRENKEWMERHEEQDLRMFESQKEDMEKLEREHKEDVEKLVNRTAHLENWVWAAIGALTVLTGFDKFPKLFQLILGK